jgi:voltage-gated potassium channel
MLRPIRLLRLVMLLRVMNRRATSSLRGRVIVYVAGSTVLVIVVAALAALSAEPATSLNSKAKFVPCVNN